MIKMLSKLLLTAVFFSCINIGSAQPVVGNPEPRPYKLLNSGKQITIKSSKNLKQVMVWTTSGNRIVEHKEINNLNCVVDIPLNQKTFFMMISTTDGKVYTEKIGIQ